jgi:hypothetical protein
VGWRFKSDHQFDLGWSMGMSAGLAHLSFVDEIGGVMEWV